MPTRAATPLSPTTWRGASWRLPTPTWATSSTTTTRRATCSRNWTRGQFSCFYYDAASRLTHKWHDATLHPGATLTQLGCAGSPPSDSQVVYEYDDPSVPYGVGRRTRMDDESGYTTWAYDARGRVLTETKYITDSTSGLLHQFVTLASYDALDRVRSQHYPADNQGTVGEEVSYSYQSAGALLTTVSGAYTDSYAQAMTYNVFGQLTQIQYGTDPLTTQQYDYYDLTTPTGRGRLQ